MNHYYRTQDREAEQSFTADQNAMDREQRTGEFEANRADAAEGRAIQREGLQIDRERLDQTAQQLAQTLEQGKFGIIEAQRLRGINDVITNPDSTPEQLDQAITMLQNLKNTDPEKFSAITLYGEADDFGVQPRTSGVMSSRTGQIKSRRRDQLGDQVVDLLGRAAVGHAIDTDLERRAGGERADEIEVGDLPCGHQAPPL